MRTISEIAREIRRCWTNPYFGAVPYLRAMIAGEYGFDGADMTVRYFLSNATTFRGEDARRLKAELKTVCGVK